MLQITNSLRKALPDRTDLPDDLRHVARPTLREKVVAIAAEFRPFCPSHLLITHSSEPISPSINIRAIHAEINNKVEQRLPGVVNHLAIPFLIHLGKATAKVAAGALLDVLANKGILSNANRG
jgi:hypothetical protein